MKPWIPCLAVSLGALAASPGALAASTGALAASTSALAATTRAEAEPLTPSPSSLIETTRLDSSYGALVGRFQAELERYEAAYKAADSATRRQLRKEHPVTRFWEDFGNLARSGEARALFWQVEHAAHSSLGLSKRRAFVAEGLRRLFSTAAREDWVGDVVLHATKGRARKTLGATALERGLRNVLEHSEHAEVRALTLYELGLLLADGEGERREEGLALLDRCAELHPATDWGRKAGDKAFELRHLAVGAEAKDFEGTSIDGAAIKLSDHRGKVVVLDFFGFW